MTEKRQKLIARFQQWLDTDPRPEIIAVQCANIAEQYAKMDRRSFKKQTTEQLDILTKWCEAHKIQFSGVETNIITSAMGEFAEKQALTIPIAVGQSERLFCPNCDTDDIYSKGKKYMCGYCGEKWVK